jgi:hypothetical protein
MGWQRVDERAAGGCTFKAAMRPLTFFYVHDSGKDMGSGMSIDKPKGVGP